MSAVQSHIQTGTTNPQFPFTDPEQHNKLLPRQPDLQRPMNPPHLGGGIPGQGSMLNLYGGGPQQQQQQQQFPQQIAPQQPQQQPQGTHPNLGIMPNNQGLVANSGGQPAMQQQLQHQNQLQHSQQQRVLLQQRALTNASGIMGNPSTQMQQAMFPPGVNPQMRRISAQAPPLPQGNAQMNMGMAVPQQNQPGISMIPIPQSIAGQLRQGGPNARILANHGPPQHHDMAHVMAMNRQQQQQQQQQTMVNGMQPAQVPRNTSGGQLVGPPHQIPHPQHQQQQSQHRAPFQQQGSIPPQQSHAPSPTRPSSHHSQSGTPTGNPMNTVTPGQQAVMRPQQTSPEDMFMNLQQQQPQNMFQGPSNPHQPQQPPRPPGGGSTFSFLPEATPGSQHLPETLNHLTTGPPNPAAVPPQGRQQQQPPFHITPVQTLQQLQQQGGQETFGHIMMQHTANQHHPHRMPSSQNATSLAMPGPSRAEPPPQAGPSRTPRPPSRHPIQPQTRGPPPQGAAHVQPILPATSPHHRRASATLTTQAPPPAPSVAQHEAPLLCVAPPPIPRPPLSFTNVLGTGQGLTRLLGFSAAMANEKCDRLKYDHWNKIVTEYFSPPALWKLTLWKDNERREAKPFEIGPNVIAMLLLVSCQSGVRSMNFVLDGARERSIAFGTSVIECPDAQWIWRFYDGHVIVLRGGFTCQISAFHNRHAVGDQPSYSLKFDSMNFDSNAHDRLINLEAIRGTRAPENVQKTPTTTTQGSPDNTSSSSSSTNTVKLEEGLDRPLEPDPRVVIDHALLPQEPINAFGIPQASMRCLELAESVGQMTELFHFGWVRDLGPQEALAKMGIMIRQQMGVNTDRPPAMLQGESNHAISLFGNNSTTNDRPPPGPLPPPPPQPVQPPGQGPTQAGPSHSPQNQPQPQPPPPASKSGPSTGVSAPSGPTSLKRKAQPPEASGTAGQADSQPPAKRLTRRKSKAGGGG